MIKFFKKLGLTSKRFWIKIEYQKRCTTHVHGCLRFIYDFELTEKSKRLMQSETALKMIDERNN